MNKKNTILIIFNLLMSVVLSNSCCDSGMPINNSPELLSITANIIQVYSNGTIELIAIAKDIDGETDIDRIEWQNDCGGSFSENITQSGVKTIYTAPIVTEETSCTIIATVYDNTQATGSLSTIITINVLLPEAALTNLPDKITNVFSLNTTVSGTDITNYKYLIDASPDWDFTLESEISVSQEISETLKDGFHELRVIGKNNDGIWQNSLNATIYTWTIDSVEPDAPIVTISDGGDGIINAVESSGPVDVLISGEPNTNFAVTSEYCLSSQTIGILNSAGEALITIDNFTADSISVTVQLTDAAGNIGNQTTASSDLDITAPDGYSVLIDQSVINNGNATSLSFTFANAIEDTTYNFIIDDNSTENPAVCDSGTILNASDQITDIDISGLDDGNVTLTVSLTDAAGNTGPDVTDSIFKDTVAPAVSNMNTTTDNSSAIFILTPLKVLFTETIETSSLIVDGDSSGTLGMVESSVNWDWNTPSNDELTIEPISSWNTGTDLTIIITGTDVAGNSITASASLYYDVESIQKREIISITGGVFFQEGYDMLWGFEHTVSDFKLGKYEVTYELWHAVRSWGELHGYSFENPGLEGNDGGSSTPTINKYEPVTAINWRDTIVWCNAYSEMNGLTPVYTYNSSIIKDSRDSNSTACDNAVCVWSSNGFRLPTEGEWQYAASWQGNDSSGIVDAYPPLSNNYWTRHSCASGATYYHEDTSATGSVAWYDYNSSGSTHEVGIRLWNALDLFDMSGNVYEWCWDWWINLYPEDDSTDYRGPATGSKRILRGGSWSIWSKYVAIGTRNYVPPYVTYNHFGLRIARTQ